MNKTYDWHALAKVVGSLGDSVESGGTREGTKALIEILGEDKLVGAVDYYIGGASGSELARSVLRILKPKCAMMRCYEIYSSDPDIERKRSAVELVRYISDRDGLAWASEFISNPDEGIQNWGASMVDQLLWDNSVEPQDVAALLNVMMNHPNSQVRERHEFIQKFLSDRATF